MSIRFSSSDKQVVPQGAQEELAKSKNKLSGIGAPWETAKDLRSLEINAAYEAAKDS